MRPDEVKAVRYKLKQTQADFATMIGVSVNTLQAWEEGRHRPDGPAEALLRVAAKSPKMVARVLGRAQPSPAASRSLARDPSPRACGEKVAGGRMRGARATKRPRAPYV